MITNNEVVLLQAGATVVILLLIWIWFKKADAHYEREQEKLYKPLLPSEINDLLEDQSEFMKSQAARYLAADSGHILTKNVLLNIMLLEIKKNNETQQQPIRNQQMEALKELNEAL